MTRAAHLSVLAVAGALTLAACGGGGQDSSATPAAQVSSTVATTAPSTTAAPAATTTPTTAAVATTTSTTAAAVAKVNANTATRDELTAAFEAAGISNASRWALEVTEYRPYPTNDPTLAKLRQNLVKYNPGPGVVDALVATLSL
jgi:hypothetical protein